MAIPMKVEKAKLVKMAGGGGLAGAAAAIGGAVAGAAGIGGMLPVIWTESEMNFRFNPSQMTLNKTASYGGTNNRNSEGGQEQYSSPGTRTLGFTVLLDEWEAPVGEDVAAMVTKLQNWCNPEDRHADQPEPPLVMFVWGRFQFVGKLSSANATFDLFRKDGSPARAEVVVSMNERPELATGTNPTSGGLPGRRTRTMVEGDSLPALAYRELGNAALWRVIADMNGIDDPASVRPGTSVLLPSATDAATELRRLRVPA